MKKIIITLVILLSFTVSANAELQLLGQGTSVNGTYNLIYDTVQNITWYDYSSSVNTWQNQLEWASALSVDFGLNTYSDWRLPTTVDGPRVYGYDGTTTEGYNITSSEMGHLFYAGLENTGYYDTSGSPTGCSGSSPYCLTNIGDFQNLLPSGYWSGTEYYADEDLTRDFYFSSGYQHVNDKTSGDYALAVMDGRAIVPEPISSILFLTGAGVLAGRRYLKRKKKEV